MKLFIEEYDNRKIRVLDYLIREGRTVKFSELVSVMNYSEKTIRSLILSYEENPYLSDGKLEINYSKAGKIQSICINNASLINVAFYYLEKSPLFIMIKELFLQGTLERERLSEKYFISDTIFSRNKMKLKKIFKLFGLELTRANKLAGSENKIRNFYFLFFSYATSEWIFSKDAYVTIEQSMQSNFLDDFHLDPAQKSMVRLLFYVCKVRSSQGFYVKHSIPISIEKGSTYESFYLDIKEYINQYWPYLVNKEEEAQLIFFFLIRGQMLSPNPYEQDALFISFSHLKSFDTACKTLAQLIINKFFNGNKEIVHLIYQEITFFLLYVKHSFLDPRFFIYNYDEARYFSKTEYEKDLFYDVSSLFLEMVKENVTNPFITKIVQTERQDAVINQLYLLIYSLLSRIDEKQTKSVKVYVQNSKVYIADILKGKIQKLFLENIEIVDIYDESVDVFITDKLYVGTIEKINPIYVPTFSDVNYVNRMYLAIGTEIIKKNNHTV